MTKDTWLLLGLAAMAAAPAMVADAEAEYPVT